MANDKRLAYIFNDINSLDINNLKKHEVLLDYNNNDIIVVKEDGTLFSMFNYIAEKTKRFLNDTHMTLENQHLLANSKRSGFMSLNDYNLLQLCSNKISEIAEQILLNKKESYNIKSLDYTIEGKKIIVDAVIKNNNLSIIPKNNIINIPNRPSKDFINAYTKQGYMDCLVYVNENYEMKLLTNVILNETSIITLEKTYIYNENMNIFINSEEIIIPLYKIRLRNNTLISSENIMGKLTNDDIVENEIIDIARHERPNESLERLLLKNIHNVYNSFGFKDHSKILMTNLIPEDYNDNYLYISMNKDQYDKLSNQSLNKNPIYKKSPYGYMARKALSIGDYITLNDLSKFTFEILINNRSFDISDINESFVQFKDVSLNDKINVQVYSNGVVEIDAVQNNELSLITKLNLDLKTDYAFLKLNIGNDLIEIYLNEELMYRDKIDDIKIKYLLIPTMNIGFGEVRIAKYGYINPIINKNTYLITNSANDSIIVETDTISKDENGLKTTSDFNIVDGKIAYIDVSFENQIVDQMDSYSYDIINGIDGNIIYIDNTWQYKQGDIITITDGISNIQNQYRVNDLTDESLILDKIVPYNYENYKVSKWHVPIKLYDKNNNEVICHIIKNDYWVRIFLDQEYTENSKFKIEFISLLDNGKIPSKIKSVESVQFGDKYTIHSKNKLKTISTQNVDITFNDILVDGSIKNKPLVAINDNIACNIKFNIYDFIRPYVKSSPIINNMVIEASLLICGGNNDVWVNGKKLNTESSIIPYKITDLEVDLNGDVNINITTETQNTIGKLIISDINIDLSVNGFDAFIIENQDNQITDFGIVNDEKILINSKDPVYIYIFELIPHYEVLEEIEEDRILTQEINGWVLYNSNNLIKLVNVITKTMFLLDKCYTI